MTPLLAALAVAGVLAQSPPQDASLSAQPPDLTEVSLRVVKIVTPDETGAGLVVGTSGDHLTIATALHVVRPADATPSADTGNADVCPSTGVLSIAFPNRPAPFTGATLVACRSQVDLALLDLQAPEVARAMADAPMLCYQDPHTQERANVIGHASGDWTVSSVDAILDDSFEGDSRRFILTGHGSNRGASGGPVLNDRPCLLGIFTTHAALGSRATSVRELMSFASSYRVQTNLIGGTDPFSRVARRAVFDDVSKTLNEYLFQMDAVAALFQRKKLLPTEVQKVTRDYNTAFQNWYPRRTALQESIRTQWGGARANDFAQVTNRLYDLHDTVVYNQLADIVALLVVNKKLSKDEQKTLANALTRLEGQLKEAKPLVSDLLDRMKPLLAAGQ
jgi:hypothetical protein